MEFVKLKGEKENPRYWKISPADGGTNFWLCGVRE